jgi:hypothetical protein
MEQLDFREALEREAAAMQAAVSVADLDAQVPTCPGWTHETLIHGSDAVIAIGGTPEVDESLAEDGIEEILFEMMVDAPAWAELTEGDRVVSLVTSGRKWTLQSASWDGESPNTNEMYVKEPALVLVADVIQPDAQITGSAAELNLWLWGRGDLPAGAVTGDATLADLVRSIAAEATQ